MANERLTIDPITLLSFMNKEKPLEIPPQTDEHALCAAFGYLVEQAGVLSLRQDAGRR